MPADRSDIREAHLRRGDFLGAFAVVRRDDTMLMVRNERHIGGRHVLTWDLPGGQVEPGELVEEALRRELREETGLEIVAAPQFLFVQEGEHRFGGARAYAWRSFFFAVPSVSGVATAQGEVRGLRWMTTAELRQELTAPYHDSFRQWLEQGGAWFHSVWDD